MLGIISMERSKVKGSLSELILRHTTGYFTITQLKDMGYILEAMGGSTLETDRTIKWRGTDCLHDQMADNTEDSTSTIRNMASGCLNGPMGGSMKACGKMGNRMDEDSASPPSMRR